MLRRLVPEGRTHRLAPMIAGMLQYATAIATEKYGDDAEEGSVAAKLFAAYDEGPEAAEENLMPILRKLFKDAGVEYERIAKSGEHYSVAEEAIREFWSWFNYPWED